MFFAQLFANRVSGFFALVASPHHATPHTRGEAFPAGARTPREIRPREIEVDPGIALAALAAGADAFARDLSAHAASRTSARGGSSVKTLDDVFAGLNRSAFRRKFHLRAREQAYLHDRGLATVLEHARRFVAERLAPASPRNDGKQTPYRGHPVFIAQHATACCCRGCLEKFHGIPRGHALTPAQGDHVIAALERWLRAEEAKYELTDLRKMGMPEGG
jgi:uncharacterized protein DUF4186